MSIHGRKLQVLFTAESLTDVTGFCGSKHLVIERDCRRVCGREQLMPQCSRKLCTDMSVAQCSYNGALGHIKGTFRAAPLARRETLRIMLYIRAA